MSGHIFVFATVLTPVRITHWRRLYKTKKHTVQYGPAHEGVCMCVCEGERLLGERALGRKRSTGENRERAREDAADDSHEIDAV